MFIWKKRLLWFLERKLLSFKKKVYNIRYPLINDVLNGIDNMADQYGLENSELLKKCIEIGLKGDPKEFVKDWILHQ